MENRRKISDIKSLIAGNEAGISSLTAQNQILRKELKELEDLASVARKNGWNRPIQVGKLTVTKRNIQIDVTND
jgi:hypothetical protein